MKRHKLICIGCPLGCELTVEISDETVTVTGNTCKKGEDYAKKEVTKPMRMLTSFVEVIDGKTPVVSVRTTGDIDKDKIFECIKTIKENCVKAPVKVGDVLIKNICGTNVDVIATKSVGRAQRRKYE